MNWVVTALLAVVGSWMTFDGARALTVGDYVTPRRGTYAGALGPWSRLVERVGIAPRSTAMKSAFVALGLLHLVTAILVTGDDPSSGWLALITSVLGLWYLPFGTLADGAALVIVLTTSLRPW